MGPMWFLPVLFVVELSIEFLILTKRDLRVLVMAWLFACLLLYCTKSFDAASLIGWIPRYFGAALFYMSGCLISTLLPVKDMIKNNRWSKRFILMGLLLLSLILSQVNGRVDLYGLIFGNYYFLYIIDALIGSGLIFFISIFVNHNGFIEYLGKYSLIILCTHEQVKRAVVLIAGRITKIPHEELRNKIIAGFIITVIVLMIELVVIQVFRIIASTLRNTKLERLVRFIH